MQAFVDRAVQRAEPFPGEGDQRLVGRRIGDVEREGLGRATDLPHAGRHGRGAVLVRSTTTDAPRRPSSTQAAARSPSRRP